MANNRKRLLAVLVSGALAGSLAACGSGDSGGSGSSGSNKSSAKGGTLYYLMEDPIEHLDPQRVYVGRDISNLSRTVYRTLVTFPVSEDEKTATTPVPDLATDTGKSSDGAKTWSFTIKDGVKWEDGKPITCEDFKYGASRVFATDVITGGPNYLLSYLDIPTDPKTGASQYDGPYKGDGQALFDKAVVCDGNTITYHFNKPWPDFPLAIAALHMLDPYRKDKDQGNKSNYQIFSNGPYKLEGTWNKNSGGTLVRNDNYDPSTDSTDNRAALPDKIVFQIGDSPETIYDRLIRDSGNDQYAITGNRVPPSKFAEVVQDRYLNVKSPYVDYLVPNFDRLKDPNVRKALAMATNQTAWIQSGGGSKAYAPALSVVNPAVVGYKPNPSFENMGEGDPAGAKALLQKAGVQMPYPIKFTYPQSDTADKQAAALKQTWDQAGFNTTLDPLGATYYDVIQKPQKDSDVMWGGWGADWPSAITVTPPLFDSRPNISAASLGQDYGDYKSNEFNALVDKAANAKSLDEQTPYLQQADAVLGKDTAYIPLEIAVFNWMWGSKVTNFTTTAASSSYPDLGGHRRVELT